MQNAEIMSLREQVDRLLSRNAMLQRHVDESGAHWVQDVVDGSSLQSVSDSLQQHDEQWFSSQPYGPRLKAQIAQTLLAAAATYSFLDVAYLRRIARNGA